MSLRLIGISDAGDIYGHVAGHSFDDVHVRIERDSDDGFEVTVNRVWGSSRGSYDEIHGNRECRASGDDLDDVVEEARRLATNLDMPAGYLATALAEAHDDALDSIESDVEYS